MAVSGLIWKVTCISSFWTLITLMVHLPFDSKFKEKRKRTYKLGFHQHYALKRFYEKKKLWSLQYNQNSQSVFWVLQAWRDNCKNYVCKNHSPVIGHEVKGLRLLAEVILVSVPPVGVPHRLHLCGRRIVANGRRRQRLLTRLIGGTKQVTETEKQKGSYEI